MNKLNPIKKKISKRDREVSVRDSSKQLADFFNGIVINLDENYTYD